MKIRFTLGTNSDGTSIKLPVIPPIFNEKFTDNTEYFTTINGYTHSITKFASPRNLTFESYFPFTPEDPLATGDSWKEPMYYVDFFQSAEELLVPVRLTLTEELSRNLDGSGNYTKSEYISVERMYIPHLTWSYKAKSLDIWYTLELKEFRPMIKFNLQSNQDFRKVISARATSKGGYCIGDIVIVSGICKKYLTDSKIEELYFGTNEVKFSKETCKVLAKNKNSFCVQNTSTGKRGWTTNTTKISSGN
jgi:hypothetical protein